MRLRHIQCQKLLRRLSGSDLFWLRCRLLSRAHFRVRTVEMDSLHRSIVTLSDFFNLCQAGKSDKEIRAAPDCDSDVEASLLRSTGSNTGIWHHSHDARRCLDEASGPLPFFACGDERPPLCVCDVRIQHRRENKSAGCANTQDGYRIPGGTISDIAVRKIWSEHLLNPVESDVSGIGTCSV